MYLYVCLKSYKPFKQFKYWRYVVTAAALELINYTYMTHYYKLTNKSYKGIIETF